VRPEPSLAAAPYHRHPQSRAARCFTTPRFPHRLLVDRRSYNHATHCHHAHSLSPPLLLVPACPRPTAVVFHVPRGSRRHGHVCRPPITPNAEAGFIFPSSLRYPVSIPISPLHRTLFSRRFAVARVRHQGPPCRPPEQSPVHLRPHLPEQCPSIELPATKPSPQEVTKAEPTLFALTMRAPHRQPAHPAVPRPRRSCHELCLIPMLLADNSSSNLRRSSGPSPALLPTRRAPP
jgi:hypothetical protein